LFDLTKISTVGVLYVLTWNENSPTTKFKVGTTNKFQLFKSLYLSGKLFDFAPTGTTEFDHMTPQSHNMT